MSGETFRMRILYSRGPELRYVGNLDMQLVWERTLRRGRLAVAFSQGFNARPRFHMAAALPLGFTSRCELLDLWLTAPQEPAALAATLQSAAPPGLTIQAVTLVPLNLPALQTQVEAAEYLALLREVPDGLDLERAVVDLLGSPAIPRTWRKKEYDLRSLILELAVEPTPTGEPPQLRMVLRAREGATGRPEEVLAVLGIDPTAARVERVRLVLQLAGTPASSAGSPASPAAGDRLDQGEGLGQLEPVGAKEDRQDQDHECDQ